MKRFMLIFVVVCSFKSYGGGRNPIFINIRVIDLIERSCTDIIMNFAPKTCVELMINCFEREYYSNYENLKGYVNIRRAIRALDRCSLIE